MIPAAKSAPLEALLDLYTAGQLRKHFGRIMLREGAAGAGLDRSLPVILFANHSNWWDGLIAFFLSRRVLHVDAYTMMEERQLARYRFFRWMGAFSVDRENPRSAFSSMAYAISLLDRPGRAVWMFPQGVMRPNDVRPLRFFRGIERLASAPPRVQLLPVAFRYEFLMGQRPECFIAFGSPVTPPPGKPPRGALTADLERRLTDLLDDLRGAVVGGRLEGFATILKGRASTNVRWDRLRGKRVEDP